ncbi:MAG: hypothetical protein ACI4OJ_11890 [Lachnospiraceae bacterium]
MGKNRQHRKLGAVLPAFLLIFAAAMTGCAKTGKKPGTPKLDTISLEADTMQLETREDATVEKTGIASSLPSFTTSTGVPTEGMEKLNEIVESAEKDYQVDLSSDKKLMMIHTDESTVDSYLQATYYQTEYVTTLTGRVKETRNLCSLAYRISDDTPITAVEALDSTGITGVELSQKVSDGYAALGLSGSLHSTNMQGFELDESGKVTKIYMKLEIDDGGEDYEEAFYVFDPATETMTELSWPGDLSGAEFDPDAVQSETSQNQKK